MHALKVLEYPAVLDLLAKHCETGLGRALALALSPEFDEDAVWTLQNQTLEAYGLLGADSPPSLVRVVDHRSGLNRSAKGGVLGAKEIYEVGETLRALRTMQQFMASRTERYPILASWTDNFPVYPQLENAISDAVEADGEMKDSASVTLATLRKRKAGAASRILERLQSYVSGKLREYLSDPIYTLRDGRYVLPVKSEHRGKVKGIVHDTSGSGQTVFIEPDDVLALGNQLREIEGAEREEIARILGVLSADVGAVAMETMAAIERSGDLDLVLAKARLGYAMKATPPVRAKSASIKLQGARHPMLEVETVVPVDIEVGGEFNGLLITGPNTGGKTVAIKCVGLCVLMAQTGLLIPARDASFGCFSQVWADIGDEQSIAQSLSTFSGHLKNIASALDGVKEGALVLFDEIGAGTDPAEGASLARALLRRFAKRGARIVASTHYGELKAFAFSEPGFRNAAMEFDSKSLRPTYRLLVGAAGASHALKIAERYGIPTDVLEEAKEELGAQHQDLANMLVQLETSQKQARQAQSVADQRAAELKKLELAAEKKLAEAEEAKKKAHEKAMAMVDDALRDIRLEVMDALDSLKQAGTEKDIAAVRTKLRDVQSKGASIAESLDRERKPAPKQNNNLTKGAAVKIDGYSQTGVLLSEPGNGPVTVQVGPLKLQVPVHKLSVVAATPIASKQRVSQKTVSKAQSATTELNIRGWRAEDAEEALIRFLDDALLGNLHQVRILHGKGEGILRKMTQDYLRRHKGVKRVRDGEPAEGGSGVTVAELQ